MRRLSELAACILFVGATLIAIAGEPQVKVALVVDKAVASKPATKPAQPAKTGEAMDHDYRLEREGCCNSQN